MTSYDDYYRVLTTLATTPMEYRVISLLPILVLAYMVEAYALLRARVMPFLPATQGRLDLLQPATLYMSTGHFFYNIDQAKDDLGYEPAMGTLEGLCMSVRDWNEQYGGK